MHRRVLILSLFLLLPVFWGEASAGHDEACSACETWAGAEKASSPCAYAGAETDHCDGCGGWLADTSALSVDTGRPIAFRFSPPSRPETASPPLLQPPIA